MVTLRADDVKEKEAPLLKRDDELCAKPPFWMR